jgi:transposase-like protein
MPEPTARSPEAVHPVGDVLDRVAREGARRLLAEMLELEVTEFLQRVRYERGTAYRGYRNGFAPERTIGVGLGAVPVRVPRVRDVPPTPSRGAGYGCEARALLLLMCRSNRARARP